MVHRVLHEVLLREKAGDATEVQLDDRFEETKVQCTCCNEKKDAAKKAQEKCDLSFLCMYLRGREEWLYITASITKVAGGKVTVFAPLLACERPVDMDGGSRRKIYCKTKEPEELELPTEYTASEDGSVKLTWTKDTTTKQQEFQMLGVMPVVVVPLDEVPINFKLFPVPPWHPKYKDLMGDGVSKGFKLAPPRDAAEEGGDDAPTVKVNQEAAARVVRNGIGA
mmetsp:Transcript_13009/g.28868  ORF Transcript_13009/g.28868 Transcript_13009/m.28868 type:complete len:224 (+) Transcript_13009:116-787(+)